MLQENGYYNKNNRAVSVLCSVSYSKDSFGSFVLFRMRSGFCLLLMSETQKACLFLIKKASGDCHWMHLMCWLVPLIIKAQRKKRFLNQAVFTWQATQPLVAHDSLLCRHWCPHLEHISSLSTLSPREILSKNRSCSLKSTRALTFRSSDYETVRS